MLLNICLFTISKRLQKFCYFNSLSKTTFIWYKIFDKIIKLNLEDIDLIF